MALWRALKGPRFFRKFGCIPWSSVISLVIKPSYSNQGVMELIKDWSNISGVFILYCCVGTQMHMSRSSRWLNVKGTNHSVTWNMDYFKALTWLMHPQMGPTGEGRYWWSFTRKGLLKVCGEIPNSVQIPDCIKRCKMQNPTRLLECLSYGEDVIWIAFQLYSSFK